MTLFKIMICLNSTYKKSLQKRSPQTRLGHDMHKGDKSIERGALHSFTYLIQILHDLKSIII